MGSSPRKSSRALIVIAAATAVAVIAVVGAVAVGGIGGGGSKGVSGSFTTTDGWKYGYKASFGSATTKAGRSNCPPSPRPGTVNLEFTLTLKNETSGRTAPIPTVGAWSNVLEDGTVEVSSPSPSNPPDNGKGLMNLHEIGFIDGPIACSPGSLLENFDETEVLAPGASRTYHGYISELPERIPKGTSVIFQVGDYLFISAPTAWWVLHYGAEVLDPSPSSTSTTALPPTTRSSTTTTRPTTSSVQASTASSCSAASVATVLSSGQWPRLDATVASNLTVDMSRTKFTADGNFALVQTKNLPSSPGYQPPYAWFTCNKGTWTYVTYAEPPGPSCESASEALKAAIAEIMGGTCYSK